MKIKLDNVKANGTFTGKVTGPLPPEVQARLGTGPIFVFGTYDLDWNGNEAYPYISALSIYSNAGFYNELDLELYWDLDTELQAWISVHYNAWADEQENELMLSYATH